MVRVRAGASDAGTTKRDEPPITRRGSESLLQLGVESLHIGEPRLARHKARVPREIIALDHGTKRAEFRVALHRYRNRAI